MGHPTDQLSDGETTVPRRLLDREQARLVACGRTGPITVVTLLPHGSPHRVAGLLIRETPHHVGHIDKPTPAHRITLPSLVDLHRQPFRAGVRIAGEKVGPTERDAMQLSEEIERSFGTGPADRPVEDRIKAGHRALRRRRAAAGLAGAGVLALLGVTYVAISPASLDGSTGNVATTASATPTPSPTASAVADPWEDGTPIRYVGGELQLQPGVVVHQHIENPYGYALPKQSDALDITFEGHRMWTIIELDSKGGGFQSSSPSNGWASFADWVADQAGAGARPSGWPDTLRLTSDGAVVASAGSEVLQRTDDPRLGDSFAPPGTPTGAALVRAGEDGIGYFVVWRVIDGKLDVITTPPRDVVGATFQELLAFARGQYSSGEGLR